MRRQVAGTACWSWGSGRARGGPSLLSDSLSDWSSSRNNNNTPFREVLRPRSEPERHPLVDARARLVRLSAGPTHVFAAISREPGPSDRISQRPHNFSWYSWGNGECGQLGHGTKEHLLRPKKLFDDPEAKQRKLKLQGLVNHVACGTRHTLLLTSRGELLSCGDGRFGKLGVTWHPNMSYETDRMSPAIIESLKGVNITQIACGEDFSLAVTQQGEVLSWGRNTEGQLARTILSSFSSPEFDSEPKRVVFEESPGEITQLVCGWGHVLLLNTQGQVFSWGACLHGQLGIGKHKLQRFSTPTQVTFPSSSSSPPPRIVQIAAGGCHSMALNDEGHVFIWGSAADGKLGLGAPLQDHSLPQLVPLPYNNNNFSSSYSSSSTRRATYIAAGPDHSLALLQDTGRESSEVYSWGFGQHGALGFLELKNEVTPRTLKALSERGVEWLAAGFDYSLAVCTDEHLE
jgi:RCC1 and BTB domain-containing protein